MIDPSGYPRESIRVRKVEVIQYELAIKIHPKTRKRRRHADFIAAIGRVLRGQAKRTFRDQNALVGVTYGIWMRPDMESGCWIYQGVVPVALEVGERDRESVQEELERCGASLERVWLL